MTDAASAELDDSESQASYEAFLHRVQARFLTNVGDGTALFTTDVPALFETYLSGFAEGPARSYRSCGACRRFVERFGGLVTLSKDGTASTAVWDEHDAPAVYRPAVAAMVRAVHKAQVSGVFLSSDAAWGRARTGDWQHLHLVPPEGQLFRRVVQDAAQVMAEKREDFKNLTRALAEFKRPTLQTALKLLRTESLYRSEKVMGPAKWLHDLHVARASAASSKKANVVWRAVAMAPAGFCHPRSSMIGTLLQDIESGLRFDDVANRFKAKMHPLAYQRPQAAPTAGAIAAAEKLVEQMGIKPSLRRRFARLDEVESIWLLQAERAAGRSASAGGVFSHLLPGPSMRASDLTVPPITMTWEKFLRTVLPRADGIEYFARDGSDSYTSFVTAVDADAPPILQWDRPDRRNPVSWYFWHGGATPAQFGLQPGEYCRVTAVCLKPSMWGGSGFEHQGQGVAFLIQGAKDSRNAGAALFPEILKAELHPVRAVIEAYSNKATMEGQDEASAAGIMLVKGQKWDALFRVTTAAEVVEYRLDRWD